MSKIWLVAVAMALVVGGSACTPGEATPDGGTGGGAGGGVGGGTGGGAGNNRAPTWATLDAVVMDEGAVKTVQLSATDEDGDAVTYEVTGGVAFAALNGSELTLAPLQTDEGDYVLQLSATDGKAAAPAELVVVVNRVNVAPVLEAVQDLVVAPGATAGVTFKASDADNDPLSLTSSGLPPFATLSGDALTVAPGASILGDFPVTVTVSDGALGATQSFLIKVQLTQAPNLAPVVTAVQQLGLGGSALSAGASVAVPPSLAATVTDPEGDEVALEAEVVAAGQPFTGTPSVVGTQGPLASLAPLPIGALAAGPWSWRLRARDAAGNASDWKEFSPGAASFSVQAASGTATGSVSINAGAANTNSTGVTLALTQVTGTISQMAFSADGNFGSATFVPFAATAAFTLPAGDGTKTVYAQFKDAAGGTSDSVDTIVLDTTDPTGTVTLAGGAAYTKTAAVSVAVSPVEGGSGLAGMCVKQYADSVQVWPVPSLSDACYVAFATPVSVTLGSEGDRRVVVWLKDAAGNAQALSAAIHYDATPPATPAKFGATGGVREVRFKYDRPADTGSGLSGYDLEWCEGILPCAAANTRRVSGIPPTLLGALGVDTSTLSRPNGRPLTARISAVDKAGNSSGATPWATATAHWPFTVTQREPSSNALNAVGYLASSGTLFLAGNKGELYTSSATGSYVRVDPMTDNDLLAVDTASSYVWIAGRNGYIGRSDDQGASFTVQPYSSAVTADLTGITYAGSTSTAIGGSVHGYVAVGEGGTLVRSTRSCVSPQLCGLSAPSAFSRVTSPVTADLKAVARCAGGPTHCAGSGAVIAVGAAGTILRSTDLGATWTTVAPPAGYDTAVFKAVVQVPGTDKVFVGGSKPSGRPALIVSTTGGTVWDAVVAPSFDDFTDITALSAQPKAASGTSNALFVAGLAGTTPTVSHLVLSTNARTQATADATPLSVVATGFASGWWAGSTGALYQSKALITPSWTSLSKGSTSPFSDVRFADGSADAAIAVGSGGRILVTADQGASWTAVAPASAAAVAFNAAWFDGASAVAVGNGAAIYRATNGGTTWGTQSASGAFTADLNGVSCRGGSACIAVGDKESILTWSGGASWAITSTAAASTANYLAVTTYLAGSTPRAVVVGSAGKVEILNNTTWSKPTSGTTASLAAVAARKTLDGVVLAVGSSVAGGALGVLTPAAIRSSDHGATWSPVTLTGVGGGLTGVTHVNANQWLASSSNGTVYLSQDDGLTFNDLVPVSDSLLKLGGLGGIHCSNKATARETCLAPGFGGGIYLTTSAGQ